MVKPLLAVALLLLCLPAAVSARSLSANPHDPSATLLDETQSWLQRTNFWNLVARGERLRERVKIEVVRSNVIEAWVCGAQKVCVSSRLVSVLSPEEQQAVVAHEVGHMLILRSYDAHQQLWEAQCDLFAVALLRDMELVKQMLSTLGNDCRNCSDADHPTPAVRTALLERFATIALMKVRQFDELRRRNFAVQLKDQKKNLPVALQHLNFAVIPTAPTIKQPAALKALNFPVSFKGTLRQQQQRNKR